VIFEMEQHKLGGIHRWNG